MISRDCAVSALALPSRAVSVPAPLSNATRHAVRVRFADTDLMGIVHHSSYLVYFEAGRVEYMRARQISYAQWVGRGVHLPVVELKVRYARPAKFDDLLIVETAVGRLTAHSVRFDYRLLGVDDGTEQLRVSGHTLLACVDDLGKLRRMPHELESRLRGPESSSREFDRV